jgi:hypothetical protein
VQPQRRCRTAPPPAQMRQDKLLERHCQVAGDGAVE